jgi:hypothetical protein
MNKIFISNFFIITTFFFLQAAEKISSDSVTMSKIFQIETDIKNIKIEHEKFEYQKSYFTQALDSQKSTFSDNLALFSAIVTILFSVIIGLASLISFKWFSNKITEFSNIVIEYGKKVDKKLRESLQPVEISVVNLKREMHTITGDMYINYKNQLADTKGTQLEQLKYFLMAIKEYLHAEKFLTAFDRLKGTQKLFKPISETFETSAQYKQTQDYLIEIKNLSTNFKDDSKDEFESIVRDILDELHKLKPKEYSL